MYELSFHPTMKICTHMYKRMERNRFNDKQYYMYHLDKHKFHLMAMGTRAWQRIAPISKLGNLLVKIFKGMKISRYLFDLWLCGRDVAQIYEWNGYLYFKCLSLENIIQDSFLALSSNQLSFNFSSERTLSNAISPNFGRRRFKALRQRL